MYYEMMGERDGIPTPVIGWSYMIAKEKDTGKKYSLDVKVENVLTGTQMIEAAEWAEKEMKNDWAIGPSVSYFVKEADAAYFRLAWG